LTVLADSSFGTPEAIAAVAFFLMIAAVVGALIFGLIDLRKTKIKASQEEALRQVVGRYEQLAASTLDAQQRVAADVSELRSRVTSIEQVLRTVE
jgi:uncharacterized membrane protein YraQ (UPF0718 family)